jgi:hypothetical protein
MKSSNWKVAKPPDATKPRFGNAVIEKREWIQNDFLKYAGPPAWMQLKKYVYVPCGPSC